MVPEERRTVVAAFSPSTLGNAARSVAHLQRVGHIGRKHLASWGRLATILVVFTLTAALDHSAVAAQQRLSVTGTIQWVSSTRIQVMTDAQVSVSIDVSRLPQGSYPLLRTGDRVNVVGVVSPDRSRLIAESVDAGTPGGGYWNLFPEAP